MYSRNWGLITAAWDQSFSVLLAGNLSHQNLGWVWNRTSLHKTSLWHRWEVPECFLQVLCCCSLSSFSLKNFGNETVFKNSRYRLCVVWYKRALLLSPPRCLTWWCSWKTWVLVTKDSQVSKFMLQSKAENAIIWSELSIQLYISPRKLDNSLPNIEQIKEVSDSAVS